MLDAWLSGEACRRDVHMVSKKLRRPRIGGFDEPEAPPGPTGHTLDEAYEVAVPTQAAKTGQTTSYTTGDEECFRSVERKTNETRRTS